MSSAASSAASSSVGLAEATGTCTVLVPAFDEMETIAEVVAVARAARLGRVVVVDDGSGDATAELARRSGAEVVELATNRGKGGAVAAGTEFVDSDVIVLIDADLVGLTPEHLRQLAGPVLSGQVDMTRGVFMGGRWRTTTAQRLTPQLSGQRAIRRDLLLRVPSLAGTGYGMEVAITNLARREGWRCRDVPLAGVSQVMKEEKRGLLSGLLIRFRMYRDIFATLLFRRR